MASKEPNDPTDKLTKKMRTLKISGKKKRRSRKQQAMERADEKGRRRRTQNARQRRKERRNKRMNARRTVAAAAAGASKSAASAAADPMANVPLLMRLQIDRDIYNINKNPNLSDEEKKRRIRHIYDTIHLRPIPAAAFRPPLELMRQGRTERDGVYSQQDAKRMRPKEYFLDAPHHLRYLKALSKDELRHYVDNMPMSTSQALIRAGISTVPSSSAGARRQLRGPAAEIQRIYSSISGHQTSAAFKSQENDRRNQQPARRREWAMRHGIGIHGTQGVQQFQGPMPQGTSRPAAAAAANTPQQGSQGNSIQTQPSSSDSQNNNGNDPYNFGTFGGRRRKTRRRRKRKKVRKRKKRRRTRKKKHNR